MLTPEPTPVPTPEPTPEPMPEPTVVPGETSKDTPGNGDISEKGHDEASGGYRALKLWEQGDDVKALQQGLLALGFKFGKADGVYGPRTRNAVLRFQRKYGLNADGVVGDETRAKLNALGVEIPLYVTPAMAMPEGFERTLSLGMLGMDVCALQAELIARGYLKGNADLVYGKKTRDAVREFQKDMGLKTDGVAGPDTLRALFR